MIQFKQYRYGFGEDIDNWTVENDTLTTDNLNGNYISIQTVPGVKVWTLNNSRYLVSPLLIGSSGILEIDFSNNQDLVIPAIQIKEDSLDLIRSNDGGYIIVNFGIKDTYTSEEGGN